VAEATIKNGCISGISPKDGSFPHVSIDDGVTNNVCFGGEDLFTACINL
tara:strand:+ start:231 stop:377 length:147 start_codon:yes stop_codon:yes gene_type:complete